MSMSISPEEKLWGDLYGLLCKWGEVRHGLAGLPEKDKFKLDDMAAQVIRDSGAFKRTEDRT